MGLRFGRVNAREQVGETATEEERDGFAPGNKIHSVISIKKAANPKFFWNPYRSAEFPFFKG